MVTSVNGNDSDVYEDLMLLPDGARTDVLDFIGSTPVGKDQIDKLIDHIATVIEQKRGNFTPIPN